MQMIRHDDVGIDLDRWEGIAHRAPPRFRHQTRSRQLDGAVYNFTEDAGTILNADGHEIGTGRGVVEPFDPNRSPMALIHSSTSNDERSLWTGMLACRGKPRVYPVSH